MNPEDQQRLERLDRLAHLLDSSIRIPGIGYRIGYDALIGLIPGIGDVAGLTMSTYIVVQAARFHLPKATLLRMVANVALEALIGAIPGAGDVFDAAYKANMRNLRLLKERVDAPTEGIRRDRRFLVGLVAIPVIVALLVIGLLITILVILVRSGA